ncbi:discoidin domain-containing receptor 2 [Folsomia candida]|uniref:discoidin domain-containing receptor 2 n=1 Tax=Folsomia candida TaxID=158441 RepID=UPI000B8EF9B6|nr:discoidin domain-containing receptor 2 [Folsomia candida]
MRIHYLVKNYLLPSFKMKPTWSKRSTATSDIILWAFLHLYCHLSLVEGLDLSQCNMPLGMESNELPDEDLSASSSFEPGTVGPQNGRLNQDRLGGAWCPKSQVTSEYQEWLQIELHTVHVITATETQGRFGNGQGAEFAEAYVISYWRPELNKWVRYRDHTGNEIIKGNINTYLPSKTEMNPPIIASKIRILPYSYHRRTVCMRVEIYGCAFRGGLLSYSTIQGSKRGENWNLFDYTYDGVWEGQNLSSGLGQLTDGRIGPNNFKDDYYGHERGKGWVGWKNETRETKNETSPVEILFKFDSVREFSHVHIHSSNQFSKDVSVFSEARLFFSIGGKFFGREPIIIQTKEDCIFEDPKNITIKLHHRVGQYVKLQLFWQSKWLLISEITFDSQPAMGNFTEEMALPPPTMIHPPSQEVGSSIAQSDASESISHNRIHTSNKNPISGPHPPLLPPSIISSEEWTSATIVLTAVISSFIAIILVLLLILTALLFRHKLVAQGKIPPGCHNGTLASPPHYENHNRHHLDFGIGYTAPEDIVHKSKGSSGGEYEEPFVDPQFSSFVLESNGLIATSLGNSNNGSNGKMAEYYSCTLVSNPLSRGNQNDSGNEYEYAELGKLLPTNQLSPMKSISNSPAAVNRCAQPRVNLQLKFRELGVLELPKRNLRMLRKLGDGVFGTVFIGELEHGSKGDKNLVAVKHLLRNATDKDKLDFVEEVRLLSTLHDPNVASVLGVVCSEGDLYSVVLEFLELGDLCQFLKQNDSMRSGSNKKLSLNSLLHIASQIASGMKFLEIRNIVHRDLAARNCVVGRGLLVKISHFATDTDQYSQDYYKLDGKMPLPIRWMAWESLFMGKYSSKSDVWSYGATLFEIFSFCRHPPYGNMNEQEVLHNLRRLSIDDPSDPFQPPSRPHACPRDVYQLMCDMWRREDDDRPSFRDLHVFLTRKNINFVPSQPNFNANSTLGSTTSSYVEHYIV